MSFLQSIEEISYNSYTMEAPAGFPVRTHEASIHLADVPTTVITSLYADRIMFIVTQLGTLGTIVAAQKDTVLGGGTTFSSDTLLGARNDPIPELCARQLVERLSQAGCDLPVLLCLGLKRAPGGDREPSEQRDLVMGIVEACTATPLW